MIKADLVRKVSEATKLSLNDGEVVVNKIFTVITDFLKRGEKIELRGFGTFGVKKVKAKVGRNMTTGEAVPLAPYTKPYFKPGRELKPWPAAAEAGGSSALAMASGAANEDVEVCEPIEPVKPAGEETAQKAADEAAEGEGGKDTGS